jgi:hypothetical protein
MDAVTDEVSTPAGSKPLISSATMSSGAGLENVGLLRTVTDSIA